MEEKKKIEQNIEQLNSFEQLIEKLATAGGSTASSSELTKLIDLAKKGNEELKLKQLEVIG